MNQNASNAPSTGTDPAIGPKFLPPADILEKGDSVVMMLDLPGADPASLDVTLDKRTLTITARVPAADPDGYSPQHMEFGSGTYERGFVFSDQMDGERIEATLRDGVLRLTVPKAADSGAKKITVKAQ